LETGTNEPKPNYIVYTYVPALVDIPSIEDFRCKTATRLSFKCFACKEPLTERGTLCPKCSEEPDEELPDVTCTGCKATFAQKSITEYDTHDEDCGYQKDDVYTDLQFHQYGDLCLQCRAPFPGEGHFEQRHIHDGKKENPKQNPLTEFLGVLEENLTFIVWEYYKPQELPCYYKLESRHKAKLWRRMYAFLHTDLVGLFREGFAYMKVAGVEHAYWSEGRIVLQTQDRFSDATDIKLDYRYWRPKECKCTQTPCECICLPAQVHNIREKLGIQNDNNFYKSLMRGPGKKNFEKNKYPSFFVYLRDSNPWGMCRGGRHSLQCERRNVPFTTYQCMMNEGRCGRCAACEKE
jgi:hypothetical protein